jgi:hypothetical protein
MERKKSVRKAGASKPRELDDLLKKLRREVGQLDPEVDLVLKLLDQLESTPGDEERKLKEKDQLLARSIIQLRRLGGLFVGRLVITFQVIEVILAELKARKSGS